MAHILDATFLKNAWGTAEAAALFTDEARFQRWLDIEAALAKVEAELGVIPEAAAANIMACAKLELLDAESIHKNIGDTGHTLVPLLRALEKRCAPGMGEYIHYGATTQDIMDTGVSLEMRLLWRIIMRDSLKLEASLLALAGKYRTLPMAGRTQCQQALPITLGLKFAGFACELRRGIERFKTFAASGFPMMMHGATGTLAGFGPKGEDILEGVAKELGLAVPPVCWNNARDVIAEFQTLLGLHAGTLMRMANTVCTLSHTEICEILEPLDAKKVGSSTMPHKMNPQKSSMAVNLGRIVQSNVQLALQGMCVEHERDTRTWRLDLHSIPESGVMLAKILDSMVFVFGNLVVNEKAIARNLDMLGGMMLSESVMFELGKTLGKQTAHHVVGKACAMSGMEPEKFRENLLAMPEVRGALDARQLDAILQYDKYIGFAGVEVDKALKFCALRQQTDPTLS